ncbi:MAG: hypothetical protein JWN48_4118 [Myxococcaceae bacterium]|nr:hypothetical protein [Myxococcaceae bacterium]
MVRHFKRFGRFVAALSLLGQSAAARAYEEQVSVDLSVGATLLANPDLPTVAGPQLELGAGVGLGDAIVLRGTAGWAELLGQGRGDDRREATGRLRVEAIYLLDVLQVVPFFGLGATVMTAVDSPTRVPLRPGGHLVLGVDYLLSRRWICGVDVRTALLLDDHQLVNVSDISLRLSRMFETF